MKRSLLSAIMVMLLITASGQVLKPVPSLRIPSSDPKKPTSGEWKLDSVSEYMWNTPVSQWEWYLRHFKTYDERKNLLTDSTLILNQTTLEWEKNEKIVNEYYSNYVLKSTKEYVWNSALNGWINMASSDYDQQGRLVENIQYNYDYSTLVITGGYKRISSYTVSAEEEIRQEYDPVTMTWNNLWRKVKNLEDGRITSYIKFEWNEMVSAWKNSERETYTYNTSGLISEQLNYSWDEVMLVWEPEDKMTWDYNAQDKVTNQYLYEWDNIHLEFVNDEHALTSYDGEGKKTEVLGEVWNDFSMIWETSWKFGYQYFPSDTLASLILYQYNPATLQFVEVMISTYNESGEGTETISYSIDNNYNIIDGNRYLYEYGPFGCTLRLTQDWVLGAWVDFVRFTMDFDQNGCEQHELMELFENGAYRNVHRSDYYWSGFIGINEISPLTDLCYFSNPLKSGQQISCQHLENDNYSVRLISMNGASVYTDKIPAGGSFYIPSGIASGMYLLEIKSGNRLYSGKILIER